MRHPFLRTLAGSGVTIDPNFENVTLLLHGDGTNGGQNNTFVDGSTNNFTITRNGNTTQGTFSPYGDNWSNYFDGTDDYLSIADNANLRAGSGTFTIEAWIYRNATGAAHTIYAKGGASTGIVLQVTSTNVLRFTHTTTNIDSTGTIALATWTHVAVVREGTGTNETKLYINGTQDGAGTVSTDFTQTEEVRIGTDRSAAADFNGYISNLRFVKGTAVYTGAFTVPTSPLTAISNTQLLTCKSNRFRDESANAFTVTRNNNASVQRFSPFSPTAAYAAGAIGGSGQSDGSGDYLTVADNTAFHFGSGNFTIEAWVYLTDNQGGTTKSVTSKFEGNAGTGPWALWIQATTLKPRFYVNYGAGFENRFLEGSAVDVASWCHLAVVRNGSTITLYQNGTSTATLAVSTNSLYVDSGVVVVLDDRNFTRNLKGGISDLRIIKGSAAYTSNFTPPTSPLTAITNTSLLLNFTNAAIVDNAMMAVPETVGNAQIDTTIKKYGTGSMKFDGTGDRLTIPSSSDFLFGTGDWTVEAWVYIAGNSSANSAGNRDACIFAISNASSAAMALIVIGNTTTTGTRLQLVKETNTNVDINNAQSISQGVWHHIAACKASNTIRLFFNGTQVGSNVTDTTIWGSSTLPGNVGSLQRTGYIDDLNGYIDDLRITKGVARYTANFTPPTAALPDL